jgi:4'-phosphopantetheinyl transferase
MTTHFSIKPRTVHLWRIWIPDWASEAPTLRLLLSQDELARAERFHFDIHREHFIVVRGLLRKILHLYTAILPEKIEFSYGLRGKPHLKNINLHFNVSHSHDIAAIAVTPDIEIGVDVEKIQPHFKADLVKRFFSNKEARALLELPEEQRHIAFYHVWSRKEALIKALGEGLFMSLNTFDVSATEKVEMVLVTRETKKHYYLVESFTLHPDYQAAFATSQRIEAVLHWQWLPDTEPLLLS